MPAVLWVHYFSAPLAFLHRRFEEEDLFPNLRSSREDVFRRGRTQAGYRCCLQPDKRITPGFCWPSPSRIAPSGPG